MKNQMIPIPFDKLLLRCLAEYRESGHLFYVPVEAFDSPYASPIGPAAGPHTQLTHNIVAAWAAGARHFELKTVQVMEGEELGIVKPCIAMTDGVFNTEWSTELTVPEARDEYVKAWFLLALLTKEFGLEPSGPPVFYASVGYDLAGIQSAKVDDFIETMKDARGSDVWKECRAVALKCAAEFRVVTPADIEAVSPVICQSVTLSTMHGCPAEEIEAIARYLSAEKGLGVFLKMNPTLLGRERVAELLAEGGFDPQRLDAAAFAHDLNYADAAAMLRRLRAEAQSRGRVFGVKLTNTLPVASRGELAGDTLYLSGKHLLPIALGVAALLAQDFGESLPLSYSGGADRKNVADLAKAGLYPITVSSALLAPGGYRNLTFMNRALAKAGYAPCAFADPGLLAALAASAPPGDAKPLASIPAADRPVPAERDHCGRCSNCVDLCPNRANVPFMAEGKRAVGHDSTPCNECGACVFLCVEGRVPWRDKIEISREGDYPWNRSR